VSIQPASGPIAPVPHTFRGDPPSSVQRAASDPAALSDVALEFVRFCYRRRQVGWPALYDEMSAVAARGAFHGMGYGDLAERGVSFCLADLPRLAALTQQVIVEEERATEPQPGSATITLSPAPLRP
jgi:hypothetical protein